MRLQGTFINRTFASEEVGHARKAFIEAHGRSLMHAMLNGFAGTAPRSVAPNLIDLLTTLLSRSPADSRSWMSDILFAVRTLPSTVQFYYRCHDRY